MMPTVYVQQFLTSHDLLQDINIVSDPKYGLSRCCDLKCFRRCCTYEMWRGLNFHKKNAMKPRNIAVSVPAWYTSTPPDRVVVDRGGGDGVLLLVGCGRLVLEGASVLFVS